MPIPPRPIPVHHPRHPHSQSQRQKSSPSSNNIHGRPGSNVPRKSLPLQSTLIDWRSEISLLNDLGPKSVPSGQVGDRLSSLGGVNMVARKDKDSDEVEGEGRRQVDLRDLIEDGKGKREKRATTATTLGFDFIPNPTILTLPEFSSDIDNNLTSPKSLLTISKSSSTKPTIPAKNDNGVSPVVSLEGTPDTPSLIPQSDSPEPPEEEEEDWEYIPSLQREAATADCNADDEVGEEDEDDIIILGELELDDEINRLDTPEGDHWIKKASSTSKKVGVRGKGDKLSYANILSN